MKIPIVKQEITCDMRAKIVANSIVVFIGICLYFLFLNWARVEGFFGHLVHILAPFIYGFAFAYLLSVPLNYIERKFLYRFAQKGKFKSQRVLSIFIVIIIALLFSVLLPQLANNFSIFVSNISQYADNAENFVRFLIDKYNISSAIVQTYVDEWDKLMDTMADKLTDYIPIILEYSRNVTSGLLNVLIGIIVAIYMLFSKERFCAQVKKMLYALWERDTVTKVLAISRQSNRTFIDFLAGKILDSFIIGCICFVFMYLADFPYAVLISVIIGVTNIIPFFGPFIGAIPSIFILFVVNPMQALWFAVFVLILQQFDGNILGPKILGASTGLSSLWVIFAILVGGGFFGFLGMVLGVPTMAVIYALSRTFIESKLKKKDLPLETLDYASEDKPIHT